MFQLVTDILITSKYYNVNLFNLKYRKSKSVTLMKMKIC